MTRNEYIAETAARMFCCDFVEGTFDAVDLAVALALELESQNCAPWLDKSPEPR